MKNDSGRKTTLGIEKNLEALLCYLLFWVSGIVIFIIEKENRYVRFHAAQSMAAFVILFTLLLIFPVVPIIGLLLYYLLRVLIFVLWLFLMYKAFNGEEYQLPYIGEFVKSRFLDNNNKSSS